MLKDKKMLALIIAIFLSVLLITGWVFADRNVMDLITATPIFEMKNTAPAPDDGPAVPAAEIEVPDLGICTIEKVCS